MLAAATWLVDVDHVKPLAILDLSPLTTAESLPVRVAGWLVAAFAIVMIGNFFYYWLHRAQHRFPWLWRFHRVHHSITEMSATNGYHHVAEDLFQFTAVTVPMAFLLGVSTGRVPWLVLTIASTHAYFIHSWPTSTSGRSVTSSATIAITAFIIRSKSGTLIATSRP